MDFEPNAPQIGDDPQPGTGGGEEQEGVWLDERTNDTEDIVLRSFNSVAADEENLRETLHKHKLQHKFTKQPSPGNTDVILTIQETQGSEANRIRIRIRFCVSHRGEAHTSFRNVKKWLAQRANKLMNEDEAIGRRIATYINRQRKQREQKANLPVLQLAFENLTGSIMLPSELKLIPDNNSTSDRVFASGSPVFHSSQMYIDFEGTGRQTPLFCSMLFPDNDNVPTFLSVGLLHHEDRFQELKKWLKALAMGRSQAGASGLTVNFWGGNESELLAGCTGDGLSLNNIQPSDGPKGLSDCYNGLGIKELQYTKDSRTARQMDTCADTFEIIKQSALSDENYRELLNEPMVRFCEADVAAMHQIHTQQVREQSQQP